MAPSFTWPFILVDCCILKVLTGCFSFPEIGASVTVVLDAEVTVPFCTKQHLTQLGSLIGKWLQSQPGHSVSDRSVNAPKLKTASSATLWIIDVLIWFGPVTVRDPPEQV